MMMKKKTQRIIGGVIAILVTISMVGTGMFGFFYGGVSQPQNLSSVSSPTDDYKNFKSLVDNLNQQVKTNPNDIGLQQALGNAYYNLAMTAQQIAPNEVKEDFKQAINNYQNVLKTKKDINVLTQMATAAFYGEQSDLADKTFKEALVLQPDFEQALFYYGVFLSEVKQDFPAAIGMWQKALDKSPTGPNADRFKQLIAQTKSIQDALKQPPTTSGTSSTGTPGTSVPSTGTPSTTNPPNAK
ncbi:MAG: tetratricopeptide repeat protein [Desulfitobacteriaceae bacterium]